MEKFVLNGGIPLRGEVSISGAKLSSLRMYVLLKTFPTSVMFII